jgi:outer membrane lipoprotein LolB
LAQKKQSAHIFSRWLRRIPGRQRIGAGVAAGSRAGMIAPNLDLLPAVGNLWRLHAIDPGFKLLAMRYAFFFACLFLAGCVAIEQRPGPEEIIGDAFRLSGRVSVKYGAEAASGRISWRHEPAFDDVMISDPLGQGIARIVRNDALARLTTADHKIYEARDVESLTREILGWSLPLAGLPDWVRGRAAADDPAQARLDSAGRLAELQQSGWRVQYLAYSNVNGLPVRLDLSREDVEIRLVIDQWRRVP